MLMNADRGRFSGLQKLQPHLVHDLFSASGSHFPSPAGRAGLRERHKQHIYNSERCSYSYDYYHLIIILLHQKLKMKKFKRLMVLGFK